MSALGFGAFAGMPPTGVNQQAMRMGMAPAEMRLVRNVLDCHGIRIPLDNLVPVLPVPKPVAARV